MPRPKKTIEEKEPIKKKSRSKKEIITVTGFRDTLPQDQKYWQAVFNSAKKIADDYSYGQLDSPMEKPQAGVFSRPPMISTRPS